MPINRPLRVFLCHSSNDKPAVRELYQKLRTETWIEPWLDEEELYPGQDWDLEIEKAVDATDVVIVVLSENAINKEGYVQAELRYALDIARTKPEETIFIIPFKLEECKVPRRLTIYQYVDYFPEIQHERVFKRLLVSLQRRADSLGLKHQPVGREFIPTEKVEKKESKEKPVVETPKVTKDKVEKKTNQAESLTSETEHSKNIEESNQYKSLIESVSISSEELKKQNEQFEALAIKQGILQKKDNKIPNKITLSNGMELMRVPAGKFLMGSTKENQLTYKDEKPQHTVDIPYDYWMARFTITNEQYNQYCQEKNIKHPVSGWEKKKNHPVTYLKWKDAMKYCKWLNTLLNNELLNNLILRLPTEAEWEKASRGTDGQEFPWGNTFDKNKCNSSEGGKSDTTPVGLYSPQGDSPYGCADMSGNVWEWTHSLFKDYPYNSKDWREDENASGRRVLRGGSFNNFVRFARCAYRDDNRFNFFLNFYFDIGFRVVASPNLS